MTSISHIGVLSKRQYLTYISINTNVYVLIPTNQLESLSGGRFAVPLPHLSRSLHDPIFFRPKVKDSVHVGLPIKAHICGLDIAIVAPSISNNDARSSRNCVKLFSEIYYFGWKISQLQRIFKWHQSQTSEPTGITILPATLKDLFC